ncbi:hypothetical protein [Rhizobium chutanense]|uniref:Uncharacterized protein n=1 Tax=Rhizobium chutanense TaxID=2035448 RepID=A0A3S0SZ82_9HYPH|nr:hypothetical protein [Rhizobium chutanense]RUM08413.1 hypothetical protein EFR84_06390 [Rhizobium chutanense]
MVISKGRPRRIGDKARSSPTVILGLVPRICCPIDRKQMLGTSPSMTKEGLADCVDKLTKVSVKTFVMHLVDCVN